MFLSFAALYWHAGRISGGADRLEARLSFWSCLTDAGVGALSVLVALTGVGLWFGLPGLVFGLLGPLHWWQSTLADKRRAAAA